MHKRRFVLGKRKMNKLATKGRCLLKSVGNQLNQFVNMKFKQNGNASVN